MLTLIVFHRSQVRTGKGEESESAMPDWGRRQLGGAYDAHTTVHVTHVTHVVGSRASSLYTVESHRSKILDTYGQS